MASVRFGLTLGQRGVFFGATTVKEMLSMAREADGADALTSVWVGDSLTAKPRPDSLTLLGALTGVTENVTLGVGCMASFTVRDPIRFSYQWANLDLLSDGRMLLAACTGLVPAGGASAREGAVWGVTDRERPARLEENIQICRRLWSGDNANFSGKFHSFEDVTINPKPVQQPCPIWIASNPDPSTARPAIVERNLRRAARLADGWMSTRRTPGVFAQNWSKLCELLQDEGRDPGEFPNMVYHNININEDKQAALEESGRYLKAYYDVDFPPPIVEAWTATGTPEQCVEHLNDLVREGVKTIALRITSWNQMGQYDRMIGEVLPHVSGA